MDRDMLISELLEACNQLNQATTRCVNAGVKVDLELIDSAAIGKPDRQVLRAEVRAPFCAGAHAVQGLGAPAADMRDGLERLGMISRGVVGENREAGGDR